LGRRRNHNFKKTVVSACAVGDLKNERAVGGMRGVNTKPGIMSVVNQTGTGKERTLDFVRASRKSVAFASSQTNSENEGRGGRGVNSVQQEVRLSFRSGEARRGWEGGLGGRHCWWGAKKREGRAQVASRVFVNGGGLGREGQGKKDFVEKGAYAVGGST